MLNDYFNGCYKVLKILTVPIFKYKSYAGQTLME